MASKRKGGQQDSRGKKAAKVDPDEGNVGGGEAEDTITACELSKNRKVSVRKWRNQVLIDIREYWYKGTQCLPGKKGISLTLDQWNTLQDHIAQIDTAVKGVS